MNGRGRHWRLGLLLGAVAAGCTEELGPERKPTTVVSGVVREGNRPVGKGWVEFHPSDGTVGDLRWAPLRPDGSFEADGVAIGVNRIGLAGVPVTIRDGRGIFDPLSSPIRRTVRSHPPTHLTIDLIEEYARYQADRARAEAL